MATIKLHDISIATRSVEVPDRCPQPDCGFDFTKLSAVIERRLCASMAHTHLDLADQADAIGETESGDFDSDYAATTSLECGRCGHVFARGGYLVDGKAA